MSKGAQQSRGPKVVLTNLVFQESKHRELSYSWRRLDRCTGVLGEPPHAWGYYPAGTCTRMNASPMGMRSGRHLEGEASPGTRL